MQRHADNIDLRQRPAPAGSGAAGRPGAAPPLVIEAGVPARPGGGGCPPASRSADARGPAGYPPGATTVEGDTGFGGAIGKTGQTLPCPAPRPAWACAFCGEIRNTQAEAEEHQAVCRRNPALRGCQSCCHRYRTKYPGRKETVGRCDLLPAHKRQADVTGCAGWDPWNDAGGIKIATPAQRQARPRKKKGGRR